MRPICVHCGNRYGQRATSDETVRWKVGEEMPPYRGNRRVIKVSTPYKMLSKANGRTPYTRDEEWERLPDEPMMTATRYTWDGESYWGGYSPFCTLRCALDYAREAYAARKSPTLKVVG